MLLCTLSLCCFRLSILETLSMQISHWYGFLFRWTLSLCFLSLELSPSCLPHSSQVTGLCFLPPCFLYMCLCRLVWGGMDSPQTSHLKNSVSVLVCIFTWSLIWCLFLKDFPHSSHINLALLWVISKCAFMYLAFTDLLHVGHVVISVSFSIFLCVFLKWLVRLLRAEFLSDP